MSILPSEIASIFEYQDIINQGSYGSVFKVLKRSNQKLYAMKVVISNLDIYNSLKNTEAELKILKELNNPYALNLDSSFKVKDKVYMVIDYCPNGDLLKAVVDKKVENQDFEEDEIWKYFIQISFGLEALHTNGFIHRDIKPQNILLDENNDVKIADFGLSRHLEASSVAGTPPFYSPKMCNGDFPTQESDIWALGCVLYYLCNLEDPFQGNKKKIKNEPHMPIKSQYSQELRDFVDWCLKKKRNERPTINEIIANELVVNKTMSLGITIPKNSAMSRVYRELLNIEREKNLQLENKLSKLSNETINQKAEIEYLKSEIATLKNVIIEKDNYIENFSVKALEVANFLENYKKTLNEKQLAEVKNSIRALIVDADRIKKIFDNSEIAQSQNINILNIQNLKEKRSEILKNPNNPELEEVFRMISSAYENDSSTQNASVIQAYQDYVKTYHRKTSIFNLAYDWDKNTTNLLIFNTETKAQESKILQTPQRLDHSTCMAQLPNGKLFCFGNSQASGVALLIDENYRVEELSSGGGCSDSSAIYFSNNIYCFGGNNNGFLKLSSRFDLGRNQWYELTPLPRADLHCNCIIFNENILISGYKNKNLLRYSIGENSFTTIPYRFAGIRRKILINVKRLFLIECENGSIYESEIGSDTAWRQIANSTIGFDASQSYCLYNKGGIYIGCMNYNEFKCFKFSLNEKKLKILV